ncbi:cell wall anchor protein [Burkholderia guangdongensis]|uniref:cell wall anchor protein n=1 Tax=Burkholderia guangdongensis TaxID=1792500 RepID=UPI0015C6BE00|nr:cell wall anchor protein [Burkholderia guangdongensis]
MKRTLIAAAVCAAAASPAFAAPPNPYLFNVTGVTDTVGIEGFVRLFGSVSVTSTAGAVVNNNQTVTLANVSLEPNYQSYQLGAVTSSVNDSNNSVTVKGGSTYTSNDMFSMTGAHGWMTTTSSSHDSSSMTQHTVTGMSTTTTGTTSHLTTTLNKSSNSSGGASIVGGLSVSGSASLTKTHTHQPIPYGSVSSTTVTGSLGVSGNAGVSWNNSSMTSQTAGSTLDSGSSTTTTVNQTSNVTNQHHDQAASKNQSDSTMYANKTTNVSKTKTWGYSNSVTKVDETVQGAITQYTDTRTPGVLDAGTGANSMQNVNGNLGVNIGEGIDNAQSNDVALASVDVGNVFGNAQIFNHQSSSGSASVDNFKLNASVGDGSLSAVSGNVGVNVASGVGNAQNNSLAGAVTTVNAGQASTVAMVATDDSTQTAAAQASGRFEGSAMLGADALHGASGNIGVNIAGGIGNVQHNGLAISALNNGH